tara:strand:- start:26181 stop:27032 length:852 start_codon:yes stop_codon:yes gene_type:complete
MRFSERIGKTPSKVDIQIDSIDFELKNGIWNVISIYISEPLQRQQWLSHSHYNDLIESIWFSFFKEPIDQIPSSTDRVIQELRKRFFNWNYLEVYDFIDFIASIDDPAFDSEEFIKACNFVLKRDLSGYRFVSGQLAPIINELEILEIEKAIDDSTDSNLRGVSIHLSEALTKLSDKKNPDYRNSIKESISAVESICQQITGDEKAELGKAIKKLKTILPIHGALEQGFIKLYGWTSDADGIRHAMMDESSLDQEDALYMLVSCSSFINYLITKANKLKIVIK